MEGAAAQPRVQKTYFILCPATNRVKIGKAYNPTARLKELETAASSDLVLLGYVDNDIESQLHGRHAGQRVRGEWFVYDGACKAHIDSLIESRTPTIPLHVYGKVNKARMVMLPPFSIPRTPEEDEWFQWTGWAVALAEVRFCDVPVPAKFLPLQPCYTTRESHRRWFKTWERIPYDPEAFQAKYPETAASIASLAAAQREVA